MGVIARPRDFNQKQRGLVLERVWHPRAIHSFRHRPPMQQVLGAGLIIPCRRRQTAPLARAVWCFGQIRTLRISCSLPTHAFLRCHRCSFPQAGQCSGIEISERESNGMSSVASPVLTGFPKVGQRIMMAGIMVAPRVAGVINEPRSRPSFSKSAVFVGRPPMCRCRGAPARHSWD